MSNHKPFTVIIIAGPTGVGKTNVAIQLAQKFDCEIINADSRQLYKEISIGTAKPSKNELLQVEHHLVDCFSINDLFTAGDFLIQSNNIINQQKELGKKAIIVSGGTGLYINALLFGLDNLPEGNEEIRTLLKNEFTEFGIEFLQKKLEKLDNDAPKNIDINNPQRLMRAIEICLVSNKKYTDFLKKNVHKNNFETINIALNLPRAELYKQINNRVDLMFENGLENEAKSMLAFRNNYALKTVGYSELFEYFDNNISKKEAIDLIKQHTRNYAKRQITWFNKNNLYTWFSPFQILEIESFIQAKL